MTKIYSIPDGVKNLQVLFPNVNFKNVADYYVQVIDQGGDVIATTSLNIMSDCCKETRRIHFLNYVGGIDALNFKMTQTDHETTSSFLQKGLPTRSLLKTDFSLNRYNVKANDVLTLSSIRYPEKDQAWLAEFFDTPFALMEWTATESQSADSYIPLIIVDGKMQLFKEEDRYEYELIVQVKLSNERFIIRN